MEETDDAAETVLEQKIMSMRRDPLFVLNPLPSSSQRKAQSLLRKSIFWLWKLGLGMIQLGELCLLQRTIEKLTEEYLALLEKKDKIDHWICLLAIHFQK